MMTNPSMSNLPGAGAMTDTLEFMKNLWGGVKLPGMNLPGMAMPSLSVEEINKQIADLKTVESWLTVNMNMLHATIKALEVQSATISTLQSMSANFNAAMQTTATAAAATATSAPQPTPQPPKQAELKPEPKSAPAIEPVAPADVEADGASAPPMANPAAWWNLLQDQFKQAVTTAITPPNNAAGKTASVKQSVSKAPLKRAARSTTSSKKSPAVSKRKSAPK